MKKRRVITLIWALLLVANIGFIWGNSMLPASESQQLSDGFLSCLGALLEPLGEAGSYVIRKAAHITEFACLGFLLSGFFRRVGRSWAAPAALCALAAACVDETIQLFSPGRSSQLTDVWIDFFGALMGMALLNFGNILWKKTRKTYNSEEH